MFLAALVFLLASLCHAAGPSNPLAIPLAPRAVNASIPTITLDPMINTSLPSNLPVTATGAQMILVTDVPELNGDALLALGEDAANSLELAYQNNCPNGFNSPDCEASILAAMNVDQQSLQGVQKRFFFLIPIAVAVVGTQFILLHEAEKGVRQVRNVRVASKNLAASKLSSAQGASTVVFATTTNGGNLITAVPRPLEEIHGPIQIVTATVDSASFHKGDYIASTSEQSISELVQYVDTYGNCDQISGQPCTNENLAGYVSGQAILEVKPGGLLSDFGNLPGEVSQWTIFSPLVLQLPTVLKFGKQVATLAANATLLNLVATFLLLATYHEIGTTALNPTQIVIPASDIVTTGQAPQSTGSECPMYPPNCSNCGNSSIPLTPSSNGYTDTNGICQGLPNTRGNFPKGCPCVNPNDAPPNAPFASMADITSELNSLSSIVAAWNTCEKSNGIQFIDEQVCKEKCPSGSCVRVATKSRRYVGGTYPTYDYQCSCAKLS